MPPEDIQWNYPEDLPVAQRRGEILAALRAHRVVVVVGDTGSGKTTQLPKMALQAAGDQRGAIGCTQPRRIAAASVARRVAEEMKSELGRLVGYQVRFDDRTSRDTRLKFMTDGILLAETQGDPDLRKYHTLILDEAHERSLNIDFLLGYLRELLVRRRDLRLVISSATLDAGAFAEFFAPVVGEVPVIQVEGRMFPVDDYYLPPHNDEELGSHVARAVEWIGEVDRRGDILVFLPGEREIRDCAEMLEGRGFPNTEVLPLFARLGMAEQQRIFTLSGNRRRIVLATNVAETSLTIPGIVYVVDTGIARVSRWIPGRGVQRLQIEPVSQASARQRRGRCGRVSEGICVRLYSEEDFAERPEFTDPEIRRSSLAGVILRMKDLHLPEISDFPFLDPPSPKNIAEGYRALREVGALDKHKDLTDVGRRLARLPVDPRLGRMLIEAEKTGCLAELLVIVAGLSVPDPRERPAEKQGEADRAQARWRDGESDFAGLLRLWLDLAPLRQGRGWQRNKLRKFCRDHFLNFKRLTEWDNLHDEIAGVASRDMQWKLPRLAGEFSKLTANDLVHRAVLAGVPRQFGLWNKESRAYRAAGGGEFAVFPGSGVFNAKKRPEWVLGFEIVETSRLWARRAASIDPAWVELVAPHLCRHRYGHAAWDAVQGAVYAKETVICGGLPIITNRAVHLGRIDPAAAREIFIRDGLLGGGLTAECAFLSHLADLREQVGALEQKLRRPDGLWSAEALFDFFNQRIPPGMCTAKAFHQWRSSHEHALMPRLEDVIWEDPAALDLTGFPDQLDFADQSWPLYYHTAPGERDDGVCVGVHVDELAGFPGWLLEWGVAGQLRERIQLLVRSLPKDFRVACQPVNAAVEAFAEQWAGAQPVRGLLAELAAFLTTRTRLPIDAGMFEPERLPEELRMKLWVCDDEGEELAFGSDAEALRSKLAITMTERFEAAAGAEWERQGMLCWDADALPESIDAGSGRAFPALVDEGKSVGVRCFANPFEAAEAHRAGCVRLLCLAEPGALKYVAEKFPLDPAGRIHLRVLGTGGATIDELARVAGEGALGGLPRDAEAFAAACRDARGNWHAAASKVGDALGKAIAISRELDEWLAAHAADRHLGAVVEDLREELAWLWRAEFAWRAGFARIIDYERHLRAIRSRLGRIASLPLVKDLEKMQRVRRWWSPWIKAWSAQPENPQLWEAGWLLEELRISLFAPDVPVRGKISEKIIDARFEALGL
jgi:ATP-dependent helicase HrpA